MENDSHAERLRNELDLLSSIYPDELSHSAHRQELAYVKGRDALTIRLPQDYPGTGLPEVVSASVGGQGSNRDVRDDVKRFIGELPRGEEVLDAIIAAFVDFGRESAKLDESHMATQTIGARTEGARKKTVVVWLHHLLNTSKRKQVLSHPRLSGVSKPGYPGVLIFAGSKANVEEHVKQLKSLNWQAFQVRLEEDEEWQFEHGEHIVELESMKDVAREVGDKKDAFLAAMRMV